MKVVSFIPIKMNSERLPGKTLLQLGDKPLCRYVFDTMSYVEGVDERYVYCSDDLICKYLPDNIHYLARDKSLDGSEVKIFDVIDAFIKTIHADIYIMTHITSPFVRKATFEYALAQVVSGKYDSAFAAQSFQTFAWYMGKPLNYDINNVPRTQDLDPVYVETSAFFIFKNEIFTKHRRRIGFHPFICKTDVIESMDIDYLEDFELASKIVGLL